MWGNRERRWLSSTRASWARVPSLFFKFQMPTLGATLEQKNGVLELTKLEYHKKWYFPIYFPNSVSGPNISKINANGPFCPTYTIPKNTINPLFKSLLCIIADRCDWLPKAILGHRETTTSLAKPLDRNWNWFIIIILKKYFSFFFIYIFY